MNMFASANITWRLRDGTTVVLSMNTDFPFQDHVSIRMQLQKPHRENTNIVNFALHIRIPSWLAADTLSILLNGQPIIKGDRGSYLTLRRDWSEGDEVSFDLNRKVVAHLYTGASQVPGYSRYGYTYGPLLLAAMAGNGTGDAGWLHTPGVGPTSNGLNIRLDVDGARPQQWLEAIVGEGSHFRVRNSTVSLVPYMLIQDQHFTVYPIFPLHRHVDITPPRMTDDPPQPRFTAPWPTDLSPPPKTIDPRLHARLPTKIAADQAYESADDGLPANATPAYMIWGQAHYGFSASPDNVSKRVYVSQYGENNLLSFSLDDGPLMTPLTVHPKSEVHFIKRKKVWVCSANARW